MKYYLIAGERSGDLHGANLIKALKEEDAEAQIRAWGGDQMQQAGAELVHHYRDMAFMGFLEVIRNYRTIRALMKECKSDIAGYRPDVLILIDYAGFNLRIASFAKKSGITVHYYISPKVWAWNTKRAFKIKKLVDRMFVIFPFEKEFYRQFDYDVDFVGNPLLDAIRSHKPDLNFKTKFSNSNRKVIVVLPGSRKQEVHNMLDVMLSVADALPGLTWVVAGVENLDTSLYQKANDHPAVEVIFNKTYDLLGIAHAALVTSGTATLETALFDVPQVVCYKTSPASYAIARQLIKVPFISLVNLVAEKEVVKELIQREYTVHNVQEELNKIIIEGPHRENMLAEYQQIKEKLGTKKASQTTARLIVKYLKS